MTHVFPLQLETFVRGLYIVQPKHNEAEFTELIGDFFCTSVKTEYLEAYRDLEGLKGACICRDEQTPWLIIVFSDDARQIRRSTLHEVMQLADKLAHPRRCGLASSSMSISRLPTRSRQKELRGPHEWGPLFVVFHIGNELGQGVCFRQPERLVLSIHFRSLTAKCFHRFKMLYRFHTHSASN
jgi:hypothetical protein